MKSEFNLLMLEDSSEDVFLIERALSKAQLTFRHLVVDTEEAFIKGIQEFKPDIILSDHSLGLFDAERALEIRQEHCPEVPLILVTGMALEKFSETMHQYGASDYVSKDDLSQLAPAILRLLPPDKA